MFKAVISRDNGTPWPETGMNSKKWLDQPVRWVYIPHLIATQPGVLFHALMDSYDEIPVGGDKYPHVIVWNGEYYLEDGHHRVMKRLLSGDKWAPVRLLKVK